jgi:hypothetical protein
MIGPTAHMRLPYNSKTAGQGMHMRGASPHLAVSRASRAARASNTDPPCRKRQRREQTNLLEVWFVPVGVASESYRACTLACRACGCGPCC